MKNIVIFGAGYVGFSLAVLLSRKHNVIIFEVQSEKIAMINQGVSPIKDRGIDDYLINVVKSGNLRATTFNNADLISANIVILALPTSYDPDRKKFDTSYLDSAIETISACDHAKTVVVKSTVPVGYTDSIVAKFGMKSCFYSPEFLREGHAIHDNLNPSRIIMGSKAECAVEFASILQDASHKRAVKTIFTDNVTAELTKLSSNAYLAMRIAFFNEIDSYSLKENLVSEDLISGICADPRIGEGYNNPSFSYGGYCLPKDVRQLQASFEEKGLEVPLISSIHNSNEARLELIIDAIEKSMPETVGIFRVQMKQGSDNLREASNYRILQELVQRKKLKVVLFEPKLQVPKEFEHLKISDIDEFTQKADMIVANRSAPELNFCQDKIFSRDIYNEN